MSETESAQSTPRLDKLVEKVQRINIFKTCMILIYHKWDQTLIEVIDTLKEVRRHLINMSDEANNGMIIGGINTIIGCVTSSGRRFNNRIVSVVYERVKRISIIGGIVIAVISFADKVLSNNFCEKKVIEELESARKINEELGNSIKEYFRLLGEYTALLDELDDNELGIFYNFVWENDMEHIKNNAHLDSFIPNTAIRDMEKICQLKLNENINNENIEFMKYKLKEMRCLPFLDDENVVETILSIMSRISSLIDSVMSSFQVTKRSEEIESIITELDLRKSSAKKILSELFKLNCFED